MALVAAAAVLGYRRGVTATVNEVSVGAEVPGGDACMSGETLAGRYRIVRFIARGGTGAVYEADDLIVGASVALKVLLPERAGSATALERLHRELALARRITHRNVCRLHDVGEDGGRVFLTMELLDGETLAARIARGPLVPAEFDTIAEQLVAALDAAHAEGVVHRDFKPQNVLLVEDRVVVTDFGLARSTHGDDGAISLTGDTAMLGTPAYMAPEQVEGREATVASDIYSLGIVLFELAMGHLPFRESTAFATAAARLHRDPPPVAGTGLDTRWPAVIARCLQRDPAARFAAVADVLTVRRAPRRRRWPSMVAVAATLAASGATFALWPAAPLDLPVSHVLPAHVRPASTKAAVMYDRADAALVAGDRVQARSHLEAAAASAPDDPMAQAALAEVLDGLGYAERAVEASKRAMRSPDRLSDEARAYVTAIDAVVRDDATATTLLERLVAVAPAEPSYRVRLATALVQAGKPLEAARTAVSVRIPPLDAALLDAAIAQASGDTTAAFAHATRALTLAPPSTRPTDHARALVLAAAARWRLDDTAGAQRDYESALQLGDTGVQLAARDHLMQLDTTSADSITAAERVRAQASLVRSLGDRAYLAELLMNGSSLFAEIGHIDVAEAMMAEARQHATALASAVSVARIDALEARLALWRGQLVRARSLAERAYRAGGELANDGVRGNSFNTWSQALLELDDEREFARARALRTEKTERFVDCVTAYRESDLDRADRIAHALANLDTHEGRLALTVIAQVAMVRGQLDTAETVLVQVASHMGRRASSIVARERLEHAQAELLAKRGHLAEALSQLDRYSAACATGGLGTCEAHTLGVAARLALAGASPDAPIRAARAIARAEQLEMHRTAREVRAVR